MRVVVSPANSINVRINQPQQQVVHGTSTFVGAANEEAQIQTAMNLANSAFVLANSALSQVNTKYSANGGILYGDMDIAGNVIPTTSNTYTLGTLSNPFESVFVGPNSLYVDGIRFSNTSGQLTITNSNTVNVVGNITTTGTISGVFDGGLF